MKKLLSMLCVLALVVGMLAVGAVSAGAADSAQTAISVKSGDDVQYILSLGGVSQPVIGCDFSVYYDSDVFDCVSVADFNNSTDPSSWAATLNPDLDGEVRGNWSILRGVDFSSTRNFLTLNLKAKADGTGHISYFVRFMYDDSVFDDVQARTQITDYVFTYSATVNGQAVAEDAQPELNMDEPQSTGNFINSKSGDSKDADPNDPDTIADSRPNTPVDKSKNNTSGDNAANSGDDANAQQGDNNSDNNGNAGDNTSGDIQNNNAEGSGEISDIRSNIVEVTDADGQVIATEIRTDSAKTDDKATEKKDADETEGKDNKPGEKDGSVEQATDAEGNIVPADNPDGIDNTQPEQKNGSTSAALWIVIIVILVAALGCGGYFFIKKKGGSSSKSDDESEEAYTTDNDNDD